MPEFHYQAKKGPWDIVEGQITALNQQEATRLIEQKGFIPIEVVEKISLKTPVPSVAAPRFFRREVTVYEICVFTRQLSGFMRSQIALLSALESITREMPPHTSLRHILSRVADELRDGKRFSIALQEHGAPFFDSRYISMVSAGESGGSLAEVLETLADFLEKEEETRGQVKAALAYPALVITVGIGTVFFLFTFCIPRLSTLFKQTFNSLPLATKILLKLAQPGWQVFFFILLGVFLSSAAFIWVCRKKYKKAIDRFIMRVPFFGMIRLKSDIARFCATLAMLLENGISVYQAVEATRPVLSNEILSEALAGAQKRVMGGEMLTSVLRESPYFPQFVTQMVAVGEESGRLAESLKEAARFYYRESARDIKVATSLIEPIFILALSLVVGFVVMGIMLPIFDMNWVK